MKQTPTIMKSTIKTTREVLCDAEALRQAIVYRELEIKGNWINMRDYTMEAFEAVDPATNETYSKLLPTTIKSFSKQLTEQQIDDLYAQVEATLPEGLTRTQREQFAHDRVALLYVQTTAVNANGDLAYGTTANDWELT